MKRKRNSKGQFVKVKKSGKKRKSSKKATDLRAKIREAKKDIKTFRKELREERAEVKKYKKKK